MDNIRPFREGDIPEVAELHKRALCPSGGDAGRREYFDQVFLHNPWRSDVVQSLVNESDDGITGFLGVVPRQEGTGGKVEIASFNFEWRAMHATVTDFVIHGTEPQGFAPFVRAGRVELSLRLLTSLKHMLDLAYLGVDRLEANIVVFPDGRTNVPTPKKAATPAKTATRSKPLMHNGPSPSAT